MVFLGHVFGDRYGRCCVIVNGSGFFDQQISKWAREDVCNYDPVFTASFRAQAVAVLYSLRCPLDGVQSSQLMLGNQARQDQTGVLPGSLGDAVDAGAPFASTSFCRLLSIPNNTHIVLHLTNLGGECMYSLLEVLVFLPLRLYVTLVLGGPGVSHFQGVLEIMQPCANVSQYSRSLRVIADMIDIRWLIVGMSGITAGDGMAIECSMPDLCSWDNREWRVCVCVWVGGGVGGGGALRVKITRDPTRSE